MKRCIIAPILSFLTLSTLAETPSKSSETSLIGALRKSGFPATEKSISIPIKSTILGLEIEGQINEQPVHFILDTGAAGTMISPELASKLSLKTTESNANVFSSTGEQVVNQASVIRRITIGTAWTENEPVIVSKTINGIDAMLGIATLADWDVRIDPVTNELTLFPAGKAPSLEGETVVPLKCNLANPEASVSNPQGWRAMNLSVPVRIGKVELQASPDTGFGGTFQLSNVSMENAAPDALKSAVPGRITGVNLSGNVVSKEAKLPEFTFGPDVLHGLKVTVNNAAPRSIREREGTIGMELLRHYIMTFRFSIGELRLKPLGNVQEITQTSSAGLNLGPGFKILSVVPDGPAAKAGLRVGDEVLEIEGHPLKTMKPEEFAALKRLPPGTTITIRYRRTDAEPEEVKLVLIKG